MKSYGIMFKAEMIRAYLAGVKTQTRRTRGLDKLNLHPDAWRLSGLLESGALFTNIQDERRHFSPKYPYGKAGDELWFKETWAIICKVALPNCECETEDEIKENHYVEYRADTDNPYPGDWPEDEAKGNDIAPKWKSSMYMDRKYSRISVPVLNVRVERLWDITKADAFAEGVRTTYLNQPPDWMDIESYHTLWDKINGKGNMPWSLNPWVWVYEFPKYENPIIGSGER